VRFVPGDHKIKLLVFPSLCQQVPFIAGHLQSGCEVKFEYSLENLPGQVDMARSQASLLSTAVICYGRTFRDGRDGIVPCTQTRVNYLHAPELFATGGCTG
jgi:hypothetical protein